MTRPRGPLPSRVYWTRRLLLLTLTVGLVVGIARLVGGLGGDGSEGPGSASQVRSSIEPSSTPQPSATTTATPERAGKKGAKRSEKKRKALPKPDGPCADSDIVVTPSITDAHVNLPIQVVLELTTVESAACTWRVDPESVFVTISSDEGPLWSSQDCPGSVPTVDVVPRRGHPDTVTFTWSGRESDRECSEATGWVFPGLYTVSAVARGAVNPVDADFRLGGPVTIRKTKAPEPTPSPTRQERSRKSAEERGVTTR